MSRPLIVCDCDEVLLHMVAPFRDWLAETQGVIFEMKSNDFSQAMRHADSGELLEKSEIWRLLGAFFDTEMDRQTAIPGAVEALRQLSERADVVVLTNIPDTHRDLPRRSSRRTASPRGFTPITGPRARRSSGLSPNTAPATPSSSTICRSTTARRARR